MKKYNFLISCGDSFTSGMEILGDKDVSEENKAHSYPIHLADLMGIPDVSNTALPGATNEFIARQTVMDVLRLEKEGVDTSKIFALIGWTSINRFEIYIKDRLDMIKNSGVYWDQLPSPEMSYFGTNFVNPTIAKTLVDEKSGTPYWDFGHADSVKFLNEYVWNDKLEYDKFFSQVMLLKGFLESKQINFLFHLNVHAWNSPNDCRVEKYRDLLSDDKRFFKFETFTFSDWGNRTYPWERRAEGHFKRPVHLKFAELLKKYIDENYD